MNRMKEWNTENKVLSEIETILLNNKNNKRRKIESKEITKSYSP